MSSLRVALFVEGSHSPPVAGGAGTLSSIWNDALAAALGIAPFEPVVPISKKHLIAMDPSAPAMSGASERLDELMARMLPRTPFDAAVVAWDLVPAWNPGARLCRREEVLALYEALAESRALAEPWRQGAQARLRHLGDRVEQRSAVSRLGLGTVVALCMEPMFEGLLVQSEQAVRRALDIEGKPRPRDWPTAGWGADSTRPDTELLGPAIRSVRAMRPKPRVVKVVPGDMRTNKDGWGEYLLRRLLGDPQSRQEVLDHPVGVRLQRWMAAHTR